jgi:hypothetical protein
MDTNQEPENNIKKLNPLDVQKITAPPAVATPLTITPTPVNPIQHTDIDKLKSQNQNTIDNMKDEDLPSGQLAIQNRVNRQSVRDAKDTNIVANTANKIGVDLNKPYAYPLTDTDKTAMADKISALVPQENRESLAKYAASIPNPNYVTPPTLNADKEKRTARLQRAAKWADALAIFGAGIGGRTINPDTLAAPSIQKARDEEFQNYKNISEANKQTANNWENNYHKQMMDWVDDQLKSNQLKESERQKYQELRDQLANQKTISDDANSTHVKTTGMNNDTALKIAAMENSLKKAEEEDKFGSPNITYQAANGQTINRVIPKPEQRDIISRAKTNPEFKKYIQTALHQTYKNVIGEDGEPKTIVVDELGKEVTDQNLLQAYLRWETTGAPNKTWPEVQSPGQVIEPDNQNTPVQQQTPQSKNDPLNLGL